MPRPRSEQNGKPTARKSFADGPDIYVSESRIVVVRKRRWVRALQLVVIAAALLYLGDWVVLLLRTGAQGSSSVEVQQFLRTPLKGQKEEFDYMGTIAEPCVPALFPHRSAAPCWWWKWHKIQWVTP